MTDMTDTSWKNNKSGNTVTQEETSTVYSDNFIPNEQSYRYFVDANLLCKENGSHQYEEREPGAIKYGTDALDKHAFQFMEHPTNSAISFHKLNIYILPNKINFQDSDGLTSSKICEIHKDLMSHRGGNNDSHHMKKPGNFRNHPVGLFLVHRPSNLYRLDAQNAAEFQDFIKTLQGDPCVSVAKASKILNNGGIDDRINKLEKSSAQELTKFFSENEQSSDYIFYRCPSSDVIETSVKDSCKIYEKEIKKYKEQLQHRLSLIKPEYKAPEQIIALKNYHALNYVNSIIESLVEVAKKIDLIHPFSDGNTRVAIVLIQRELVRHGLPPAILKDPNTIEVLSVEEFIKQQLLPGMSAAKRLSKDPYEKLFGYTHVNPNINFDAHNSSYGAMTGILERKSVKQTGITHTSPVNPDVSSAQPDVLSEQPDVLSEQPDVLSEQPDEENPKPQYR